MAAGRDRGSTASSRSTSTWPTWQIGMTSPLTARGYGYDLLAFCRCLDSVRLAVEAVTTEVLLDYLRAGREASVAGPPANVVLPRCPGSEPIGMHGARSTTLLVAVGGLFAFRTMREPATPQPGAQGTRGPAGNLRRTQRAARAPCHATQAAVGVATA